MPTRAPYTPFYGDLPKHKQTLRLRGLLERLGMPEKWSHLCFAFIPSLNAWCLEHNGGSADISELSPRQIAEVCGWPDARSSDGFVEALVEAGFLDHEPGEREGNGFFHVHNLDEYLRPVLHARERARQYRERKRNAERDASRDGNGHKGKEKGKISTNGNGSNKQVSRAAERVTSYAEKPAPAAPGFDSGSEQPPAEAEAAAPATGHAPGPVPAAAEGSAEAERMRRWTIFATLLRNWGLSEPNVRRVLHWIGTDDGGRKRDLDVNFAWRVLGTIKGIQGLGESVRKGAFEKAGVKDGVAYLIGIFREKPSFIPVEDNLRLARQGWEAVEAELAAKDGVKPPDWLVMFLTGVGK